MFTKEMFVVLVLVFPFAIAASSSEKAAGIKAGMKNYYFCLLAGYAIRF